MKNTDDLRVLLYTQEGATRVYIDAAITRNGDLQVAGHDIGEAPKQWWGHDDYEYSATIRKRDKDRLLLALIERQFGNDASAVSRFRDFASEKGIPYAWFSWP